MQKGSQEEHPPSHDIYIYIYIADNNCQRSCHGDGNPPQLQFTDNRDAFIFERENEDV